MNGPLGKMNNNLSIRAEMQGLASLLHLRTPSGPRGRSIAGS